MPFVVAMSRTRASQKQQLRIVHERLRKLDPLLHARRVGLYVAVSSLSKPDVEEDFVRALHRVRAPKARQLAAVRDEGNGCHAGYVRVTLRYIADAGAHGTRRFADVIAQHAQTAARGREQTKKRLDERALARAVGTKQSDGAVWEIGADVAERFVPAVCDGDVFEND
jgi:hypothetical protein